MIVISIHSSSNRQAPPKGWCVEPTKGIEEGETSLHTDDVRGDRWLGAHLDETAATLPGDTYMRVTHVMSCLQLPTQNTRAQHQHND